MAPKKSKKPELPKKPSSEDVIEPKCPALTQTHCKMAVGVDFGTSYVSLATLKIDESSENSEIKLLVSEDGHRHIPSCVAFTDDEVVVGVAAQQNAWKNLDRTISNFKQFIGRRWDDEDVQRNMSHSEVPIVEKDGRPAYRVFHKGAYREWFAEEIVTLFFEKLKETFKGNLGYALEEIVVSFPTYYESQHISALETAIHNAGLRILGFIKDPIACLLALDTTQVVTQDVGRDEMVILYDLGGSGIEMTVVRVRSGMYSIVGSEHDDLLGGYYFDEKLCEFFSSECLKKWKKDITNEKKVMCKLRLASEISKRQLSTQMSSNCILECLYEGMDFQSSINRTKYEFLCDTLFQRVQKLTETVLERVNMSVDSIDKVILSGAGSRMPKIQLMTRKIFGEKIFIPTSSPVEDLNVIGATLHASLISRHPSLNTSRGSLRVPVLSGDFYIEKQSEIYECLFPKHVPLPCQKTHRIHIPQEVNNPYVRFYIYDTNLMQRVLLAHILLKREQQHQSNDVLMNVSIHEDGAITIRVGDTDTHHGQSPLVVVDIPSCLNKTHL